MIRKIKTSLTAKLFLATTVLLILVCLLSVFSMARYIPQTYSNRLSAELQKQANDLVPVLEKAGSLEECYSLVQQFTAQTKATAYIEDDYGDILYSLAYAVKSSYKAVSLQEEIHDFAVYPLEGIWTKINGDYLDKAKLEYTIMIRQPDFISEEMVNEALGMVKIKKPNPLLEEIHFETMQNGLCVEVLHVGAFDDEPVSFEKMDQFSAAHGLRRSESYHREIYLSNANRVEKSKLKTILRYSVEQIPAGSV